MLLFSLYRYYNLNFIIPQIELLQHYFLPNINTAI